MKKNLDKILAEISAGELIDKITILQIKKEKIVAKDKVAEIEKDRQKYTEFLRQPATGDTVSIGDSGQEADQGDGGDDTPPIRPEGTTEPGSGYQAGAPQYTRPAGTTQPGSGYQAGAAQYTQSAARSRAKKAAEKLGTKLATGGR